MSIGTVPVYSIFLGVRHRRDIKTEAGFRFFSSTELVRIFDTHAPTLLFEPGIATD